MKRLFSDFPWNLIRYASEFRASFEASFPGVYQFVDRYPMLSAIIVIGFVLVSFFVVSGLLLLFRALGLKRSSGESMGFELKEIPLDRVVHSPHQPRSNIDQDKLKELETSIRQHGIITPILVTPIENGKYQIVAGHRRVEASKNIGKKSIPAIVREYSEEELFEVGFLENLQREDMGVVDTTEMYVRLRTEFKSLDTEELSELIGKPVDEIESREWIFDLPNITRQALNANILSENLARTMVKIDEEHHRDIIRYVAREEPTEKELRQKLMQYNNGSFSPEDIEEWLIEEESFLTNSTAEPQSTSTVPQS